MAGNRSLLAVGILSEVSMACFGANKLHGMFLI
jgi:hypothetical protein